MPLEPQRPARRVRRWLPWLALALVPVFFAAGFGLVAVLAGRGDDAEPEAATAARTTVAAAPDTAADPAARTPTTTAPGPATPTVEAAAPVTTVARVETGRQGRPAAPGTIEIDYGRWRGMFELRDAALVPSLQAATVGGRFTYLGGAGCPVRTVVVDGRFYDRDDVPVGLAHWESRWVTGGGGLEQGKAVPFGAYGNVLHLATSAELEVVRVACS